MDNNLEIPIIETPKIKVYAKLDSNKIVKEINSSIFIRDSTEWIEIDEGLGDKFAHAQSQYLEKGLTDNKGRYNYKYDAALVDLTEEEKNILFPVAPPVLTLEERTKATEDTLLMLIDMQTGGI